MTNAEATVSPGKGDGNPPTLLSRQELERRVAVRQTGDGGFASLIAGVLYRDFKRGRDDVAVVVARNARA